MTDTLDRSEAELPIPTPAAGSPGTAGRTSMWFWFALVAVLAFVAGVIVASVGRSSSDNNATANTNAAAPPTTAAPASTTPTTAHDHGAMAGDDHHHDDGAGGSGATPTTNKPGFGNPAAHGHGDGVYKPMDSATAKAFSAEMQLTRDATMLYPTVADAKAAGLRPVGRFAAGSGSHLMVGGNPMERLNFNPAKPLMWLFAGDADTAPVVGVMFYSMTASPPEGYSGPNDGWHQHTGLCLKYGAGGVELPLPIDADSTLEQCQAVQGQYMPQTGYMIHVWSAPGWESPEGAFSHDNKLLVCADGRQAGEVALNEGCDGLA